MAVFLLRSYSFSLSSTFSCFNCLFCRLFWLSQSVCCQAGCSDPSEWWDVQLGRKAFVFWFHRGVISSCTNFILSLTSSTDTLVIRPHSLGNLIYSSFLVLPTSPLLSVHLSLRVVSICCHWFLSYDSLLLSSLVPLSSSIPSLLNQAYAFHSLGSLTISVACDPIGYFPPLWTLLFWLWSHSVREPREFSS